MFTCFRHFLRKKDFLLKILVPLVKALKKRRQDKEKKILFSLIFSNMLSDKNGNGDVLKKLSKKVMLITSYQSYTMFNKKFKEQFVLIISILG